ncbi:TetR/AcrR family transcriptional regulator [Pseudoxanthomonas sp. 10H]|uniref:TetR/AcrR family transcriptional regulator n=1 Tax=Pseudoxanthomonas sp. 10H TaxID=3242729 RepID=UPI003557AB42
MARSTPPARRRRSAAGGGAGSAPPRGRGRPGADAPDLRPRLLDAALACYADKGIAATSLRDIARHAGVTPALLHYYFGDGRQLLDAVVEERVLPALAPLREAVAGAGDDMAALVAAFVDGMADVVVRHPWLPALWVREVVSEGGALRGLLTGRIAPAIPVLMASRFAAAQARGELNPALDPRLLMVSLVGLTLFPAAGAPIWRQIFDAGDLGVDDLRRHALALLDRGLELRRD